MSKTHSLFLCLLLACACACVCGQLQDDSADRRAARRQRNDDDRRVRQRTVTWDKEDPDRFELEMRSGEDKLEYELRSQSGKGARVEFEYSRENNFTERSIELRARFIRIVEFNTTGSDRFTNNTVPCSQYRIGVDSNWNNIVRGDSGQLTTLTAQTVDSRFRLLVKVVPTPLVTGNETLSPNSVKVDIIISNYPYQCSNSKLALETRLRTTREIERPNGVEIETEIVGGAAAGFFSWEPTVDADGADVPVLLSEVTVVNAAEDSADGDDDDNEVERRVYYTFDTTDAVTTFTWDPELGVTYPLDGSDSSGLSAGAVAGVVIGAIVLVVAVVAVVVRRRRNSQPTGEAPHHSSSTQMA